MIRSIKTTATIAILCFGLSGCGAKKAEEASEAAPEMTVDVAPVLSGAISLKVSTDAVLFPVEQAAIASKISAPIRKLYVNRGDRVHAGQLLAELESQDLSAAVIESQAAYEQAEAAYQNTARSVVPQDLQRAELDVKTAKETVDTQQRLYDDRQALYKQGAIAQKEVNETSFNLNQARSQYEFARKHLEDLQGVVKEQTLKVASTERDAASRRIETAQVQMGYSKITSPIDGVVTDRPVYPGEAAVAGMPIMTIMDLSRVVGRAHFSPQDAAEIKIGDRAHLLLPGATPFDARVTQISPALDPASTTVEVWIQADNADARLKPGIGLRAEVIVRTTPNALVIPMAAVLTSATGKTSVIAVTDELKPEKKPVTLGIRDGGNVEVVEGLENGERVVTVGAFALANLAPEVREKTKVIIQAPKEEDDEDE